MLLFFTNRSHLMMRDALYRSRLPRVHLMTTNNGIRTCSNPLKSHDQVDHREHTVYSTFGGYYCCLTCVQIASNSEMI